MYSWPASFPQAYGCANSSGPTFGNFPNVHQGSNSQYTNTNLRFSEVTVRNLSTNQTSASRLWKNNNGDAGNTVVIDAPTNAGYEIKFTQLDGCSSACMTVMTSTGPKAVRLQWSGSQTFGLNGSTYVSLTPSYTGYLICY